jgi:hypothetical protein
MSSYLREMNPQVWWIVNVDIPYTLEDPQTQAQKNAYILKFIHLMIYLMP